MVIPPCRVFLFLPLYTPNLKEKNMLGSAPYAFTAFVNFFWIAVFLLIGLVCRGLSKTLRKYLVPACAVGGILGFIAINTSIFSGMDFFAPDPKFMEFLVFHLFALSFTCFGLQGFGGGSNTPKSIMKGGCWMGIQTMGMSNLQCFVGILCIVGWNSIFNTNLFESSGFLVAQGFCAGPGAALATGAVWEQAGVNGMIGLGLAFAGIGYFLAMLVGVPVTFWVLRRTGRIAAVIPEEDQRGVYPENKRPAAGYLRFMGSNIDTMSFQASLIALSYGLSYLVISLLPLLGTPAPIMGMLWSLFPMVFCLPMGFLIREIFLVRVLKLSHLFDVECHQRLLGIIIDWMVIAALLSIQLHILREWFGPIILISFAATLATILYLWFLCRKHKEYGAERFLVLLGGGLGTITTGLVLMRMTDPEFKSTIPYELSLCPLFSIILGFPLMPLTMPIYNGQAIYGSSWLNLLILSFIYIIIVTIILKLPFWKMEGKVANF